MLWSSVVQACVRNAPRSNVDELQCVSARPRVCSRLGDHGGVSSRQNGLASLRAAAIACRWRIRQGSAAAFLLSCGKATRENGTAVLAIEPRAFEECLQASGRRCDYLSFNKLHEQVAVQIW